MSADVTDNSPEYFEQLAKQAANIGKIAALPVRIQLTAEQVLTGVAEAMPPIAAALRAAAARARENAELRKVVESNYPFIERAESAESANRELRDEVERLNRRCDIYAAERNHARLCLDRSVGILSSIHALCWPPAFKGPDGKMMVFRPPSELANEAMQAISDRIREIPDKIAAIATGTEQENPHG